MKLVYFSLLVISLLTVSCARLDPFSRQTIPYVREVIAGEHPGVPELLAKNAVPQRKDAIFIIGESQECSKFAGTLLAFDHHDNVDGSSKSDFLPDFAGETIVPVVDLANAPFSGYIEWRNEDFFRELTVKSVISAVDSVCYLSPYDRDGDAEKKYPKLIVLASSYCAEYGLFDVDSLFTACGCGIHLVNPLNEMMDDAIAAGAANIGVMSTAEKISSGIYSTVFQRKAREKGIENPECVAFGSSKDSSVFALAEWLDNYIKAGLGRPLDALIVDDLSLSPEGIALAVQAFRSVHNEASMKYSGLFAEDFVIVDARNSVAEKCFEILRENNLFTHNVRYPVKDEFLLVPCAGMDSTLYTANGLFTDDFKYSRLSASADRTFMLIQYNERYVPR